MPVFASGLMRWSSAVLLCLSGAVAAQAECPKDDSGLTLPPGFCATVFADDLGHARHLVVSPTGVVYVNTWSGRYFANQPPPPGGFLVALQDTLGTGKANVIQRFGATVQSGGAGGTGIGLYNGWLYAEINDKIVRYALPAGALGPGTAIVPTGAPQTIVLGLPLSGDHPMHPFAIDAGGSLYVDVATATNSCQQKNRTANSPGIEPCVELQTRGGIWRFDANKPDQLFSADQRYATGLRNGEGFGVDAAGQRLFVSQHGRDQLHANWPALYPAEQEATLPAEEVLALTRGADYGWPECYYDPVQQKLVLAPEYGGDGGKKVGPCASKIAPLAAFPAHWAPNAMVYYDKQQFPERYRNGLFIAFHGSWDRAPYPQQGYNLVFQSLTGDAAGDRCQIFADGFAGPTKSPGGAAHRPSGAAEGPDGALYVSDDVHGRIYRIVYTGKNLATGQITACPSPATAAGPLAATSALPPEGMHPDAGSARAQADTARPEEWRSDLAVAPGATPAMVALGERIYRGQVGGAACSGCHGADGAGTPLGPDLTDREWLWSDGSVQGIAETITAGVAQPKQYRSPMPAMGGAQLSPDQVSALAAYVWGLSHRSAATTIATPVPTRDPSIAAVQPARPAAADLSR